MTDTTIIPGVKVLLVGGAGSGKTHAIKTLVEAGLEVFVVFTEPGLEVISDTDPSKVHWAYIRPTSQSFEAMANAAKRMQVMDLKTMAGLSHMGRESCNAFTSFLSLLNNFKCERTGKEFGSVETWGTDKALVVDSLSGLSIMLRQHQVGTKPVMSQAEWQIVMQFTENFIQKFTTDLTCHAVMTAHPERKADELTGGQIITIASPGQKLAGKIPYFFSDVINSKREGTKFSWDTTTYGMDLKARNVPIARDIEPSFVPLLQRWKSRQFKTAG